MNDCAADPPRYRLTFSPDIAADLVALENIDPAALDAAEQTLDDLAYGRLTGKELGARNVSGDLSGLARVKFDTPGKRPQRFRVVYRQVDDTGRYIIAIGQRDHHAIYQAAVRRLPPP
jgi:hypothetical protein